MSFRPPSLKMPAEGTAHDPMHMVATVGTCHDSPVKMATTGWNINTHQTSKQQNKTKQKKEKQHKPTTPKPTQQSASLCPTWPFTCDWHGMDGRLFLGGFCLHQTANSALLAVPYATPLHPCFWSNNQQAWPCYLPNVADSSLLVFL